MDFKCNALSYEVQNEYDREIKNVSPEVVFHAINTRPCKPEINVTHRDRKKDHKGLINCVSSTKTQHNQNSIPPRGIRRKPSPLLIRLPAQHGRTVKINAQEQRNLYAPNVTI